MSPKISHFLYRTPFQFSPRLPRVRLPRNILNFKIISPRELGALQGAESITTKQLREAEKELHQVKGENERLEQLFVEGQKREGDLMRENLQLVQTNRVLRGDIEFLRGQSELRRREALRWENQHKNAVDVCAKLNQEITALKTSKSESRSTPKKAPFDSHRPGKPFRDEDDHAAPAGVAA